VENWVVARCLDYCDFIVCVLTTFSWRTLIRDLSPSSNTMKRSINVRSSETETLPGTLNRKCLSELPTIFAWECKYLCGWMQKIWKTFFFFLFPTTTSIVQQPVTGAVPLKGQLCSSSTLKMCVLVPQSVHTLKILLWTFWG